jgi:histidyl-tRNA synthetase
MKTPPTDVYIVHQGETAQHHAWQIARQLRQAGISTLLHCGGGNFKAQMKKADASGARFAVIIGDNEIAAQQITLKSLRLDLPQQAYCAADAIQHILTFRSSQP